MARDEAPATAAVRAKLEAFTGRWKVERRIVENAPIAASLLVTIADDSVDPVTHDTTGTRLRIMDAARPTVPAIDRAPFLAVDEGKRCEDVDMGNDESLTVCHDTRYASQVLRHTVTLTSHAGGVTTGSSTATQTMALEGRTLRYTYKIDGTLEHDLVLARP